MRSTAWIGLCAKEPPQLVGDDRGFAALVLGGTVVQSGQFHASRMRQHVREGVQGFKRRFKTRPSRFFFFGYLFFLVQFV